jgi:hypothetical protein
VTTFLPPHLEAMADTYKLFEWVDKVEERRQRYFLGLDQIQDVMTGVVERAPDESTLVTITKRMLELDRTFTGHIRQWEGSTNVHEQAFWEKVWEAGAAAIVSAYLAACAGNEWPERQG